MRCGSRKEAQSRQKEAILWLMVQQRKQLVVKDIAQKIARVIFSGFVPGVGNFILLFSCLTHLATNDGRFLQF
jgi:hypothetical protein